jgi:hypothetical protein
VNGQTENIFKCECGKSITILNFGSCEAIGNQIKLSSVLGALASSYLEKIKALEEKLESAVECIGYAYDQKEQKYGMEESEAIHFRMRKVFSLLEEWLTQQISKGEEA